MKKASRQKISLLLLFVLFVQLASGVPQPYIILEESKREYAQYPKRMIV